MCPPAGIVLAVLSKGSALELVLGSSFGSAALDCTLLCLGQALSVSQEIQAYSQLPQELFP